MVHARDVILRGWRWPATSRRVGRKTSLWYTPPNSGVTTAVALTRTVVRRDDQVRATDGRPAVSRVVPVCSAARRPWLSRLAVGMAVLLMAGAAGVTVFSGGRWHWASDLLSHFVVQSAACSAGSLAILSLCRRRGLVCVASVLLLVNLSRIVPMYRAEDAEAEAGPTFRALAANLRRDNREYPRFIDLVRTDRPDFFVPWRPTKRGCDLCRSFPNRIPIQSCSRAKTTSESPSSAVGRSKAIASMDCRRRACRRWWLRWTCGGRN